MKGKGSRALLEPCLFSQVEGKRRETARDGGVVLILKRSR